MFKSFCFFQVVFFLLAFGYQQEVQAQQWTGGCAGNVNWTSSISRNGKPAYTGTLGATLPLIVYWNSSQNRWEVDVLSSDIISGGQPTNNVAVVNTLDTTLPPNGAWTPLSCNPAGSMSGFGVTAPVEFVSFTGTSNSKRVRLDWATAQETDNAGFDVEHSTDALNWARVGVKEGHATIETRSEYVFDHNNPVAGVNYYRLKQIDFDGAFEYSEVVMVEVGSDEERISIFPNPSADGKINIRHQSTDEGDVTLRVFDTTGRLLVTKTHRSGETTNNLNLDLGQFGGGLFYVEVTQGGKVRSERVLVN